MIAKYGWWFWLQTARPRPVFKSAFCPLNSLLKMKITEKSKSFSAFEYGKSAGILKYCLWQQYRYFHLQESF